jgi:hypothetical protein
MGKVGVEVAHACMGQEGVHEVSRLKQVLDAGDVSCPSIALNHEPKGLRVGARAQTGEEDVVVQKSWQGNEERLRQIRDPGFDPFHGLVRKGFPWLAH